MQLATAIIDLASLGTEVVGYLGAAATAGLAIFGGLFAIRKIKAAFAKAA